MATTKYSQTIKGNKKAAESQKRLVDLLTRQVVARDKGRKNLSKQYANARNRNLASRRSVVRDLIRGQNTALQGYDRSEKDAQANVGTATASARLNRTREGANAMAELSNYQAGLTDRIKGMGASLRAVKANLDPVASDYQNAVTSLNNSIGDLNASTQTNINNELRQQNVNDAQAFAEFSAGNQQAYADLVDLFGQRGSAYEQMADILSDKKSTTKSTGTTNVKTTQKDSIKETKGSKKAVKGVEGSYDSAGRAAELLAGWQGKTFTAPIKTIAQMNAETSDPGLKFTAAAMKTNQSNLDELGNSGTLRKLADAEGSRLRRRVEA